MRNLQESTKGYPITRGKKIKIQRIEQSNVNRTILLFKFSSTHCDHIQGWHNNNSPLQCTWLFDLSSSLTKTQVTLIRHFWKLKYFSTFPGAWKYLENKRILSWDDMNSDGSDGEGKHRNDFLERKKWFLPTKPPLCSVAIKQTYSSTTCPICCRKTPCCWPAEHWSRWNCQIRRQRVVSGQKRAVAAAAASPVQCSVPVLSNLLRKF